MLRNKKGFTLIEVLVCIIIISILAMITVSFLGVVVTSTGDNSAQVEVMTQDEEAALEKTDKPTLAAPPEVKSDDKGKDNKL